MSTTINNVFSVDGTDYQVRMPESADHTKAQMAYNKTYGEAIKSGGVLRAKLNEYMQEQKIWSQERSDRTVDLAKSITAAETKLAKGGIKLSEAIKLASKMRKDRKEFEILATERATSDSNTAEGQAENARFQKLVSLCLVYKNDGNPVYSTVEQMLDEKDEKKLEVANKAFDLLGKMLYKLDDSLEASFPENKFLREWNRLNDKFQLLDEKGRAVNEDGKLIDEKGRLINENGELVNLIGELITEDGDLMLEAPAIFLDEDGKPLTPPNK